MGYKISWFKIYDFQLDGEEPQSTNTVRTVLVNNKYICLGRLDDGYYAVDDKCPHAAGRLGQGKCDAEDHVICPIHRYKYNLKTGKGAPGQGDYVNTYPIEKRNDGVYIGFKKKSWFSF